LHEKKHICSSHYLGLAGEDFAGMVDSELREYKRRAQRGLNPTTIYIRFLSNKANPDTERPARKV